MFRKPMRIEKWLAFDGAMVDTVEATDQGDFDDMEDASSFFDNEDPDGLGDGGPDDTPFAMADDPFSSDDDYGYSIDIDLQDGGSTTVTIGIPDSVSAEGIGVGESFLPFWSEQYVDFSMGEETAATDFFFEISATDGGSFRLFNRSEIGSSQAQQNAFILANNLHLDAGGNNYIAVLDGSITNGAYLVRFLEVQQTNDGNYRFSSSSSTNGTALAQFVDGGVRFVLQSNPQSWTGATGEDRIESILRSLVYTKNDASETAVTEFTIAIYHNE